MKNFSLTKITQFKQFHVFLIQSKKVLPNLSMALIFINLQHIKFIYIMTFQKNMMKYNLQIFNYNFLTKDLLFYVYILNIFQ
jgi:hypothetical protein